MIIIQTTLTKYSPLLTSLSFLSLFWCFFRCVC